MSQKNEKTFYLLTSAGRAT